MTAGGSLVETEGDARTRLYLITPPALGHTLAISDFASALESALDAGDAACVQLRMKDVDDKVVRQAIADLMPLCHARDVAFIMNDRPDLAAALRTDGVHIGAEDGDYESARSAVGPDAIVGVSCYNSRDLGIDAAEAGADYVAFGAFFPTETKDPPARADPDILRWWQSMVTVPCVAIGGITAENCDPLVAAGADFLAVISGVWDHPEGPAAAVKAYESAIEGAMAARQP